MNSKLANSILSNFPDNEPVRQSFSSRDAADFRRIFKCELKTFWLGSMLGFDVVKFDDEIIKPGPSQSTRQAIQQSYGTDAVKLIEHLIKY